ncbi:MAG: glycosyltransferase [Paludibacteraceae bacterium]|nr:glycosyltransferase [Paludibacteraceae bacterium]
MSIGWYNITECDLYMIGAMLAVLVFQLYFYLRYIRLPKTKPVPPAEQQRPKHAGDQLDLFGDDVRGVSVIVAARNEAHNLRDYLHSLLEQDYPMFEIIVVDDGSEDNTRDILDEFMLHYPRLRRTFVPQHARIISSKKLALTLGIKAARFDYLLFTDADCRPASKYWIWEMMNGFDRSAETDVVLGFGAYFKGKGMLNRLIRYDTLFNGLHYLGAARCHHPYMGVGRNLAYKKEWFLSHNGFSPYIGERAGDDDLIVNRYAKGKTTATVTCPNSVTWSPSKRTWQEWWHQRRRHLSVSPHYTIWSKLRLGAEPLSRALWYGLAVALIVRGATVFAADPMYGMTLLAAVLLLLLMRLILRAVVLNQSAHRLGYTPKGMHAGITLTDLILWDILLPLCNLWILIFPTRKPTRW